MAVEATTNGGQVTFHLTPAEAAALATLAAGSGGFQTLTIELQAQLKANGSITLSDAQVGAIVRAIGKYSKGGFQSRFRRAFGRSIRDYVG